jgi:hypothetical protein
MRTAPPGREPYPDLAGTEVKQFLVTFVVLENGRST